MKKTKLISIVSILSIIILSSYFYVKFLEDFNYYKDKKYLNKTHSLIVSAAVNAHFYNNYKIDNYENIDLQSVFSHYGWEHNLSIPNNQGLYIVKTENETSVCCKGFDKRRSEKVLDVSDLNIFNYLSGADIILFTDSNIYNICDIRPWEDRWFIKGVFKEDPQIRSKMNDIRRSLVQLRPSNYSRKSLSKVLFHGIKNTANSYVITCACQRKKVNSEVIDRAIDILEESSKELDVDEFYLPASLPIEY